jgi:branched-chain amino acid aminotransferase
MKELVYVNGDLLPSDRAVVPLLDRGYLYGEGLFESMRAYGGRIFALDRHLARLLSSAATLGLELGVGEDELARILALTLEANDLGDAYLRLTVSQRCDAPGIESRAAGKFTISVIARELAPRLNSAGMSVVVLEPGSAPPPSLARHKTLSFLAYVQGRGAARARQAQDALLVNAAGEITEATTSNVFVVLEKRLVTPPIACGVLPGVTRAIALELARAQGIQAMEEPLRPEQLAACSECFLTNSIAELQPVTHINGHAVGSGAPGPVWAALTAAYSRITGAVSGA